MIGVDIREAGKYMGGRQVKIKIMPGVDTWEAGKAGKYMGGRQVKIKIMTGLYEHAN
jgi:hypothetical protein